MALWKSWNQQLLTKMWKQLNSTYTCTSFLTSIHKLQYMRNHVLCNLSYAIKKCHLQLILICKLVAKDTISKYSAFCWSLNIVYRKWVKEQGECDMCKGRFKVICGVVELKKNILLYFWLPTWSLNHVQKFGIFLQNFVNFETWNLTNFSSSNHWIHNKNSQNSMKEKNCKIK
jgi:hypothetical protein